MSKSNSTNGDKACFIIMPISTPDDLVRYYKEDKDHFSHVLDNLILPAIRNTELKPIPPSAKGSDLITPGIIEKLWNSDYVLCDMSSLNPNVLFELGIRTALNKPAILIKDEYVDKIPFDIAGINCHKYESSLNVWEIKTQISRLEKHINDTVKQPEDTNTLWKYFGIEAQAFPVTGITEQDKTDLIINRLQQIEKSLESTRIKYFIKDPFNVPLSQRSKSEIIEMIPEAYRKYITDVIFVNDTLTIYLRKDLNEENREVLNKFLHNYIPFNYVID